MATPQRKKLLLLCYEPIFTNCRHKKFLHYQKHLKTSFGFQPLTRNSSDHNKIMSFYC